MEDSKSPWEFEKVKVDEEELHVKLCQDNLTELRFKDILCHVDLHVTETGEVLLSPEHFKAINDRLARQGSRKSRRVGAATTTVTTAATFRPGYYGSIDGTVYTLLEAQQKNSGQRKSNRVRSVRVQLD